MTLPYPPHQYIYKHLPPTDAPAAPQPGQLFEVGTLPNLRRYRVQSVSARGFTVASHGTRTTHPLVDWHGWLTARCREGPVMLHGNPMRLPAAAGLVAGSAPAPVRDVFAVDLTTLRQRMLAGRLLACDQTLTRRPDPQGQWQFAVRDGDRVVTVRVSAATPPLLRCDCGEPQAQTWCRHQFAVVVSQPDLQYLALDALL